MPSLFSVRLGYEIMSFFTLILSISLHNAWMHTFTISSSTVHSIRGGLFFFPLLCPLKNTRAIWTARQCLFVVEGGELVSVVAGNVDTSWWVRELVQRLRSVQPGALGSLILQQQVAWSQVLSNSGGSEGVDLPPPPDNEGRVQGPFGISAWHRDDPAVGEWQQWQHVKGSGVVEGEAPCL